MKINDGVESGTSAAKAAMRYGLYVVAKATTHKDLAEVDVVAEATTHKAFLARVKVSAERGNDHWA